MRATLSKSNAKLVLNRREFLDLAWKGLLALSGLLGLGVLLRFFSFQGEATSLGPVDLGPASDFPLGSEVVLPGIPAVVRHTESGFSALSLTCTHLGCGVSKSEGGFACPCHGSRYSEEGAVVRGPAKTPLKTLRVEQTSEGHLLVDV